MQPTSQPASPLTPLSPLGQPSNAVEFTPALQRPIVDLVQIGELPRDVRLERLVKTLGRQAYIEFRLRPRIEPGDFPHPPPGCWFFSEREIFPVLCPPAGTHLTLGITSLRIAPANSATDAEGEHFGIWQNDLVQVEPEHARIGVVSVTRWRERYEARAFRSTEQYIAFMVLSFIGDVALGGMTHRWCTGCVFDFNIDDESIVSSVKNSDLCDPCRRRMRALNPELEQSFRVILADVARPPVRAVLSYLQGNGIASVFLFSVLLTLSVGLLQSVFQTAGKVAVGTSAICALIFFGVVWYVQRYPSGGLK